MTSKHQTTPGEAAFWQLLEERSSRAVNAIFKEAEAVAYQMHMVCSYCFQPEEYEEAMQKMCLAAIDLTKRDHELLEELVCAALSAAASIDPCDFETPAGYRVYSAHLHQYYKMITYTLEDKLWESITEKIL